MALTPMLTRAEAQDLLADAKNRLGRVFEDAGTPAVAAGHLESALAMVGEAQDALEAAE